MIKAKYAKMLADESNSKKQRRAIRRKLKDLKEGLKNAIDQGEYLYEFGFCERFFGTISEFADKLKRNGYNVDIVKRDKDSVHQYMLVIKWSGA